MSFRGEDRGKENPRRACYGDPGQKKNQKKRKNTKRRLSKKKRFPGVCGAEMLGAEKGNNGTFGTAGKKNRDKGSEGGGVVQKKGKEGTFREKVQGKKKKIPT